MKKLLQILCVIACCAISVPAFSQCNPVNLITNADFESGNTGVGSDLLYNPYSSVLANNYLGPGSYTIGDAQLTSLTNGVWTLVDHTTGSGHAFVADGAFIGPMRAWYQNGIAVTPNTVYQFSAWANDLCYLCGGQVTLELRVNGISISGPYNVQQFPDGWVLVSALWNSGSATTADIDVYQTSATFNGNDYALDDIYFGQPFLTADASPDENVYCATSPHTSLLNVTVGGGIPAYTYSWSPAAGLNNATIPNPIAITTSTTTFTVTVTDGSGCTATDSVTINHYNNGLVVTAIAPPICSGGSGLLTALATYPDSVLNWSWTPSTGLSATNISNPVASPTVTTTYVVTASVGSCTASYTVTLNVNGPCNDCQTASNVIQNNVYGATICEGNCTTLSIPVTMLPPGMHYQWWDLSNPTPFPMDTQPTVCPTADHPYYVYVYDANMQFCDSAGIMVYVTPDVYQPVSMYSTHFVCTGDSITLDMGAGANMYSWSGGPQTQTYTVSAPGFYYGIVYTCQQVLTIGFNVVQVNCCVLNTVGLQVSPPISICLGDTVAVSAYLQDSTLNNYSWYAGTDTFSCAGCSSVMFQPTAATDVYVVVYDAANNCYYVGNSYIDVINCDSTLRVDAGNDVTITVGNTVMLQATPFGFSGVPIYSWSDGNQLIATTDNLSVSPVQTTTYRVMAQDSQGQGFATDYVTVFVNFTTGVNEVQPSISYFEVSPNPAQGTVTLTLNMLNEKTVTYSITNLLGEVLLRSELPMQKGIGTSTLDISELPAGVYFVTVDDGIRKDTRKLIRQ